MKWILIILAILSCIIFGFVPTIIGFGAGFFFQKMGGFSFQKKVQSTAGTY